MMIDDERFCASRKKEREIFLFLKKTYREHHEGVAAEGEAGEAVGIAGEDDEADDERDEADGDEGLGVSGDVLPAAGSCCHHCVSFWSPSRVYVEEGVV